MNTSDFNIQSWLGRLKDDKTLIVKAAGKAQKASDWILGRSYSSGE